MDDKLKSKTRNITRKGKNLVSMGSAEMSTNGRKRQENIKAQMITLSKKNKQQNELVNLKAYVDSRIEPRRPEGEKEEEEE